MLSEPQICIIYLECFLLKVQRELEELRKIRMIHANDKPRELEELVKNTIPNRPRGPDRSQTEQLGQLDPILRSDGERG